jgi:hypothetical protein
MTQLDRERGDAILVDAVSGQRHLGRHVVDDR